MISGINGGNCILSSMAKIRIEKKMIHKAKIAGKEEGYVVEFYGSRTETDEDPVLLCSARNPYEPRLFKSLDGAVSELNRMGLMRLSIEVT